MVNNPASKLTNPPRKRLSSILGKYYPKGLGKSSATATRGKAVNTLVFPVRSLEQNDRSELENEEVYEYKAESKSLEKVKVMSREGKIQQMRKSKIYLLKNIKYRV